MSTGTGLIGPGDLDDDDPDQQLMKLLAQRSGKWICKACGRTGNRRDNMKRHVENVHLPRVLRCRICQMLVRNRQTFYRHMKRKHGITNMKETEQYKDISDSLSFLWFSACLIFITSLRLTVYTRV